MSGDTFLICLRFFLLTSSNYRWIQLWVSSLRLLVCHKITKIVVELYIESVNNGYQDGGSPKPLYLDLQNIGKPSIWFPRLFRLKSRIEATNWKWKKSRNSSPSKRTVSYWKTLFWRWWTGTKGDIAWDTAWRRFCFIISRFAAESVITLAL